MEKPRIQDCHFDSRAHAGRNREAKAALVDNFVTIKGDAAAASASVLDVKTRAKIHHQKTAELDVELVAAMEQDRMAQEKLTQATKAMRDAGRVVE